MPKSVEAWTPSSPRPAVPARELEPLRSRSPTGMFGPPNDQHAELRRHDVEPLGRVLADLMQCLAAARAGMVIDVDHHLHARQMSRRRSAVHATLATRRSHSAGLVAS